MLQVGMLFADIYDPMKALSIILALSCYPVVRFLLWPSNQT